MKKPSIEYNIVLLGDTKVGKSTLLKRLHFDTFEEAPVSTMGIDRRSISKKDIDGQEIITYLIDTPGTDKYRKLEPIPSWYKKSDAALILYDVTKENSFQNIVNWIEIIKKYIEDKNSYSFLIMGTKNDLSEKRSDALNIDDLQNKAEIKNLDWAGEISSKNMTKEQIQKRLESLLKLIHDRRREKKEKEILEQENEKKKSKGKKK